MTCNPPDHPAEVGPADLGIEISSGPGEIHFDWDFGDETPHSSEQHPHHDYAKPGIYHVTCHVQQTGGPIDCLRHRWLVVLGGPFKVTIQEVTPVKGGDHCWNLMYYMNDNPGADDQKPNKATLSVFESQPTNTTYWWCVLGPAALTPESYDINGTASATSVEIKANNPSGYFGDVVVVLMYVLTLTEIDHQAFDDSVVYPWDGGACDPLYNLFTSHVPNYTDRYYMSQVAWTPQWYGPPWNVARDYRYRVWDQLGFKLPAGRWVQESFDSVPERDHHGDPFAATFSTNCDPKNGHGVSHFQTDANGVLGTDRFSANSLGWYPYQNGTGNPAVDPFTHRYWGGTKACPPNGNGPEVGSWILTFWTDMILHQ